MCLGPLLLGFVVLPLLGNLAGRQVSGPSVQAGVECAVTKPNGIAAREQPPSRHSHGDSHVSVVLWPDGTVEFRPGGAGRLDSAAPPLRAEVPSGYGERGFQATYLIFPTLGCWEVTGRVGDARVTFVTRIVKIGDGPAWRRDVP